MEEISFISLGFFFCAALCVMMFGIVWGTIATFLVFCIVFLWTVVTTSPYFYLVTFGAGFIFIASVIGIFVGIFLNIKKNEKPTVKNEVNDTIRIQVKLKSRDTIGAESMWAKNLGNGKYQIKNIPFYAYGLNLNDVVFAKGSSDGEFPVIQNLVEANGHRTLRIEFIDNGTKVEHLEIIKSLGSNHIKWEGNGSNLYALDVAPGGNFDILLNAVKELENKMILKVEACEAGIKDGFDDALEPI